LLSGFSDMSELPRVWVGVMAPLQGGTAFGIPGPVSCAEAIAEKAMRGEILNNRNPNRCIGVLPVRQIPGVFEGRIAFQGPSMCDLVGAVLRRRRSKRRKRHKPTLIVVHDGTIFDLETVRP
jgi:hypothetical protein